MQKIFSIGRVVVQVGWAKSLLWGVQEGKDYRTYFFTISSIEREGSKAFSIIVLPIAVIIGVCT